MAVTELSRDELGRLGYGLRGSYLVQQAGYTRGIAAEDGQSLLDMLPAGYLDETAAAQAIVEKAQGDRCSVPALRSSPCPSCGAVCHGRPTHYVW